MTQTKTLLVYDTGSFEMGIPPTEYEVPCPNVDDLEDFTKRITEAYRECAIGDIEVYTKTLLEKD